MEEAAKESDSTTLGIRHNVCFHHTAYRVKDPLASIKYYNIHFGFKLLHHYERKNKGQSSYFLRIPRVNESFPIEDTEESEKYLWSCDGSVIEFMHSETNEGNTSFVANNGNVEPHRGFGHIAVSTDDVIKRSEELENNGALFQKRPSEGRMKTIAFVRDLDSYWIELINRSPQADLKEAYNVSQTMLRVKDPAKTVPFYVKYFGMRLVGIRHFSDFSLYFLASIPQDWKLPDPETEEGFRYMSKVWNPVLELTHNHGTESDENFSYHNGNDEPKGFGHVGFLCDNIATFFNGIKDANVKIVEELKSQSCVVCDPDNYHVKVVERGAKF